jgi:ribosomal protein S18 acetylase RimI-like enzyme
MSNATTYRPAQARDSRFIAEMIDVSSDGIALIDWTETAQAVGNKTALDVGAENYSSGEGDYSYRNCFIAEQSGQLTGMLLSFTMNTREPSDIVSAPPFDGTDVFAPYKYLEEPNSWYICGVAVTPEHRGRGIGRELMQIARKQAITHGHGRLSLVVFEENRTAIRLYQSQGYKVVKRAPVVPHPLIRCSGDALLMVAPTGLTRGAK